MPRPFPEVQVMDTAGNWQTITNDVMGVRTTEPLGLQDSEEMPGLGPAVGKLEVAMWNGTKAYTPDVDAVSAALINADRRIRLKIIGTTYGKALQLQKDGIGGELAAAVITITATGSSVAIGNNGGTVFRQAQSFTPTGDGILTQFTFVLGANTGSPTGGITWEIRSDAGGTSGPGSTVYRTSAIPTPTASATNTVNISSGPLLLNNVKYWLVLFATTPAASGNFWNWTAQTSSVYAGGNEANSTNGGSTWNDVAATDASCTITLQPSAAYYYQSVTTTVNPGDSLVLAWDARAQFDTLYNSDAVQIVTTTESGAKTVNTYTNKWLSKTLTFIATIAATTVLVRWIPQYAGVGVSAKTVEYRNITLKKNGGSNLLTNGDFATGAVSPWAASNVSGVETTPAIYDSPNQDSDVWLETPSGAGGTTTISTTHDGANGFGVGTQASTDEKAAQSFQVAAGILTQIKVEHWTNVGTPTSTATWEIRTDSAGAPGTILQSGAYTPTANVTNTITVTNGVFLSASTTYWLVLRSTSRQSNTDNYWVIKANPTSIYANGSVSTQIEGSSSWTNFPTYDMFIAVTTGTATEKVKLAQSVVNGGASTATVTKIQLWLKKVGTPTGTLTLTVRTNDATNNIPTTTAYNVNAVATASESALSTSYGWIDFTFASSWDWPLSTTVWIELDTDRAADASNFVVWGADASSPGYASGQMMYNGGSSWVAETKDAIFKVIANSSSTITLSVIDQYKILFNGFVKKVIPSAFARGGDIACLLQCEDFVSKIKNQSVTSALAVNQKGDQLIRSAVAGLQQGTLDLTLPGIILDPGVSTFPFANDQVDSSNSAARILDDVSLSEGPHLSFWYVEPDGTLVWQNGNVLADLLDNPVRIAFAGVDVNDSPGQPFFFRPQVDDRTRITQVILSGHPRQDVAGTVVVAQATSAVQIPAKQADGTAGSIQVTLSYRDPTTSRPIGAKGVISPAATTDYVIKEFADGTGVDYTTSPSFSLTVDAITASEIIITMKNTATGPLYATKLQCRATDMLVTYDPLKITKYHDQVTINKKQPAPYSKDLPLAADAYRMTRIADYLLARFNTPWMEAPSIQVTNRAQINNVDLLDLDLFDVVTCSDAWLGMTAKKHAVKAIGYNLVTDMGGIAAGSIQLRTFRLDENAKNQSVFSELPTRATLSHQQSLVTTGAGLTTTIDGLSILNQTVAQTAAANGDTFTQGVFLRSGTYLFSAIGKTDASYGKIDWYIDNVLVIGGQDWYSASLTRNVVKAANMTVVGDGYHTLKGVVNGKNASSSAFTIALTKMWFKPVFD